MADDEDTGGNIMGRRRAKPKAAVAATASAPGQTQEAKGGNSAVQRVMHDVGELELPGALSPHIVDSSSARILHPLLLLLSYILMIHL